jgi:hypothetical protein
MVEVVVNKCPASPERAGELTRVRCKYADDFLEHFCSDAEGLMDAMDVTTRRTDADRRRSRTAWLAVVRVPSPVLQGLLAFALYLAVFIAVYARPLFPHLRSPELLQYFTDPNFYIWSLQWWPYAVSHGINPLFTSQIGAPQGYELAWASTSPAVGLLMWPVTSVFGVLASFNAYLLLAPPVAGWAAFLAARRLTGRFWASLLAGAAYGLCPFELNHDWQGDTNLTMIALLPLMVYLVLLWWEGALRSRWFAAALGLAMAVEFYTFTEAFLDMTLVWAGGLAIGFAVAGPGVRRKVARLAALAGVAYAGAVAAASPYLYYALKHNQTTAVSRQSPEFSLRLARLVLPSADKVFRVGPLASYSRHLGWWGLDNYIGLPIILVMLALAVFAWRNRLSRLLAAGFVFVTALAAGPALYVGATEIFRMPWAGLWSLPIARSAEPSRFIVFIALVLALGLALWLAIPAGATAASRLWQAARWALGVLAVAAILAATPTASQAVRPLRSGTHLPSTAHPVNQLPAFLTEGLYRDYLKPGEIVVIVTARGNAGMLFQADADFYFRIAGGYINQSLTPVNAVPHPITEAADPSKVANATFENYIRTSGVGAIIVEHAWQLPWMSNFSREYHMRGISVGGVTVYPTAQWLATLKQP